MTIFAYGHTGAGKTYTIFGSETTKGLLHYATDYLLHRLSATKWVLSCSFVEIYNETFRDLLAPQSTVRLVEDKKGQMVLQGAREVSCSEQSEVGFSIDEVIAQGMRNRSVGGTNANA